MFQCTGAYLYTSFPIIFVLAPVSCVDEALRKPGWLQRDTSEAIEPLLLQPLGAILSGLLGQSAQHATRPLARYGHARTESGWTLDMKLLIRHVRWYHQLEACSSPVLAVLARSTVGQTFWKKMARRCAKAMGLRSLPMERKRLLTGRQGWMMPGLPHGHLRGHISPDTREG